MMYLGDDKVVIHHDVLQRASEDDSGGIIQAQSFLDDSIYVWHLICYIHCSNIATE